MNQHAPSQDEAAEQADRLHRCRTLLEKDRHFHESTRRGFDQIKKGDTVTLDELQRKFG